jgi:hypothetical protein
MDVRLEILYFSRLLGFKLLKRYYVELCVCIMLYLNRFFKFLIDNIRNRQNVLDKLLFGLIQNSKENWYRLYGRCLLSIKQ